MSDDTSSPTDRYFLMSGLLQAFYWLDESLQNHFRAAGHPQVSRTQSMIMSNLADGITRPAELARRIGISRQAVQQLLLDLQKRGLVDLVQDPDDARAKIVRYNTGALEIGHIAIAALDRIDTELEKRIGRKAVQSLHKILVDTDWGAPIEASAEDLQQAISGDDSTVNALVKRSQSHKKSH